MPIIRVHKDPLKQAPDIHHVGNVNLLEWLTASDYQSIGEQGAVILLNGAVIADSGAHDDMNSRTSITLGELDNVDVMARANGVETVLGAFLYTAVFVGIALVLLPKLQIPNDAGKSKSSPNNQLNAASNGFRPNEAIPQVFGEVVCYPDFIQPSFYVYENNRRKFTELFGVSMGRGLITKVKDGESLFDDLQSSSYQIFSVGEGQTPTGLFSVQPAANSLDYPLPAPDLARKDLSISNGSFIDADTMETGLSNELLVGVLGAAVGSIILVSVQYTFSEPDVPLYYNEQREVAAIVDSQLIFVTDALKAFPSADTFSLSGAIFNETEPYVAEFFVLPGDQITAVRFQVTMPSGIRNGLGTVGTVAYNMTVQRIDENGDDIGAPETRNGAFSGNSQDFLGRTEEFSGLTAGRYKARCLRLSESLGNNSVDTLSLERVESVTPYTTTFPDMTIIRANRSSSPQQPRGASEKVNLTWKRKLQEFNPVTGTFGAYVETRSFAQAVMHVLVNMCEAPISNIDYETLFEIEASLADERLGYFDFSFDDADVSARSYIETICNAARVSAYEVASNWRFVRDERKSTRVALFNRRNVAPQSSKLTGKFQRGLDFDSVEVRYVDPVLNTSAFVRKRINQTTGAIEDGIGARVSKLDLAGCRNEYQAANRALREIGAIRYQRQYVSERALMDAIALGVGERVGWGYIADSKVFTGEVLSQFGNVFTTSERFTPEAGLTYYVYITNNDGTTTNSVLCAARTDSEFGFVASGLTSYSADGYEIQMGSIYMIAANTAAHDYIITKRGRPAADGSIEIELVNYDERAYPAE